MMNEVDVKIDVSDSSDMKITPNPKISISNIASN